MDNLGQAYFFRWELHCSSVSEHNSFSQRRPFLEARRAGNYAVLSVLSLQALVALPAS